MNQSTAPPPPVVQRLVRWSRPYSKGTGSVPDGAQDAR